MSSYGRSGYRKRRRFGGRRTHRVPRPLPLNGFAPTILARHRYCDNVNVYHNTADVPNYHAFSCNSMFDPDNTGVGHQPMGFDEMAAIYGHYSVVGSKITVRCTPAVSLTTGGAVDSPFRPFYFGVLRDDDNTTPLNLDTIREQKAGKWAISTIQIPRRLSNTYSAKSQYGVDWATLSAAGVTASPTNQTYFLVWCMNSENGNGYGTCCFEVTIEYICLWSDLRQMSPS